MRADFFLTIIVAVVLLTGMCWPSEAVARGGCSSCQAGSCQAETPVQYQAPMAPSVCPTCPAQRAHAATLEIVQGEPVRNVARGTFRATGRVLRGVGRVATAPFRWLRGGCN